MTGWPGTPVIYEVNTAIWLSEQSRAAGRPVTLADVPASAWDEVTPDGIDAVWLMGVWERSPAGLELTNANAGLQASFREALPDLRSADVIGSPYCVRRYVVDASFGGPRGLAEARAVLAARGIRLLLDYVPNHVAPDHPWVTSHPDLFVNGDEADIEAEPASWVRAGGHILAHGRDPYFPPWPDVVQLNAFSPALRAATAATLTDIAAQCDGIRCDMAMLMTNQVFAKTWGGRPGPEPDEEFWPSVIAGLRRRYSQTVLVAEAYWDTEWTLQQQGFDFCYDKRLYDRIVGRDVAGVRDHLRAGLDYQSRLVRFGENHDEPRIADKLPGDAGRAAAVAIATLPGATLWHEGQFEGRRVRPPVFLSRRPDEPPDTGLAGWYRRLLARVASHRVRSGDWQLLESGGWSDNDSCRNLLAWSWSGVGAGRHLVVAWDLAFHCIPLAMVDPEFAKSQLDLMLSEGYLHSSGQMPAYEWNFGDVNPPVHAFATLFLANLEADLGKVDLPFLQESFAKLLLNFTWWVNRKDPSGRNVFEGGFLGLDNIGVFDRSAVLPGGGRLEQADGTAWMAMFSQNMLELALMLLDHDETYQGFVLKFVEHFFWIAAAVDPLGENPDEMWDEEDGFFYDVLRLPDGTGARMKVRSLVGLLPLCATTVIEADVIDRYPRIAEHVATFLRRNQDLLANIADPFVPGVQGRRLLSLVNEDKLRRILARMLDEERFLGPHGIRSVSRWHLEHPYTVNVAGGEYSVRYEPAESTTGMFGGNSNWRGPVWFPVNLLLIRALIQHYRYYGDDLRVECPTGSGTMMTLFEVAEELTRRLVGTFLRDGDGKRPVYGGTRLFHDDPHWRDLILFYEYFHGDNGAGLGASHQTGWTGLVARLIQSMGQFDADTVLEDRQWPMARPYRRLAAASMPDVATAREARGVTEPRLPRPGRPRR